MCFSVDCRVLRTVSLIWTFSICGPKWPKKVRLKVRANSKGESPYRTEDWSVRSGRQLRRREAGWRAAGSERPVRNQNNDELDSAKMDWRACLFVAKPRTENRPVKGERKISRPMPGEHREQKIGMHRVVGDRMVGSWSDMNQGSRAGKEQRSWSVEGPKNRAREVTEPP
jgi:hypothetical protein